MRVLRAFSWIAVACTVSAAWATVPRSAHAAEACNVAGDIQQVSKTLSDLGRATEALPPAPECNTGEKAGAMPVAKSAGIPTARRAARLDCPAFLKSAYLTQDRYRGFLDDSASESCRVALATANRASVAEIERRLSKNSISSLGAPEQFLEKCLEDGVSVQHWQVTMPPSNAGAPVRPWTNTTVEKLGDNDKKALTAEYYLSMNRLRTGSQAALETVAAIDSTLGQRTLADRRCDDSRLLGIDDTCRRLQACAPSNALAAQAAELDQVLPLVQQLEAKKSQGEATRGLSYLGQAYGGNFNQANAVRAEVDAAIGEASKQLQLLKSMYPALDGKEFRKALDPKKRNTEEALRLQLEATRKRVVDQLDSYRKGMDCLNSPFSCSAECEEYPKALAQAPEFRVEAFKSAERTTSDDLDVQAYLGAAECRQGIRTAKKEAGDVVKDFAIGAGLTIATAGVGSIAAGAKAAMTVAQTARATGAMGRVAEILAKPLFEVSASARTAAFARAAVLGGDVYFAADGVNNAIDQCSEALNELSPGTGASSESSAASSSGCPGAEDSKQVQVMADYRACVLSAALNVAPNLLPFVPAFVKAYRSGTRRVAAAKPAVERLTKARLLESTAPGRYQAVMKSGAPVEIIVESTREGSQSVRAVANGQEVGQMKAVYDLQKGKYSVTWVETAESVGGKSYRGEGLNSLMMDASLKELGGADRLPMMMGLLTTENSRAFHGAKQAFLEGGGEFSFAKNPRLKAYHELRDRARAENRKLTEAELKSFSSEVELDDALNRKVFSEATPAGKMRADRGYEPVEVEVANTNGTQPVRYVAARRPSAGAIRPSEFISMKEVELASQVAGEAKLGIVVLDANMIGPDQARKLGVSVIDHHGPYRNADKPFQNTTRKIVDLYEDAAKAAGSGADPAKVREAFYRKLLNVPEGKPVPEKILVATDNLGDAALAKWLIDNPAALESADSRRLLKMAAFHEDYAHFGTKYQGYLAKGGKAGNNFAEGVEFSQAVMAANDRIIRKFNAEAAASGKPPVFVGDRFSDAPPELQQKIMAESVAEIDRAMKDPAYRRQLAEELRSNLQSAIGGIQQRAMVRTADSKLVSQASSSLGRDEVDRVIQNRLAIFDSAKLDTARGQFTNWGALPASHSNPLQLQLNDHPSGAARTFVLSIPQGRKDQGLINDRLQQAIIDAAKAKDPGFNASGVVLRDSGLLFSFAGVPLSKQELSALVIRHVSAADGVVKAVPDVASPASRAAPSAPAAPPIQAPVKPSVQVPSRAPLAKPLPSTEWHAAGYTVGKIPPREPRITGVKLEHRGCTNCPTAVRLASPLNHANQHVWDALPPRAGESFEAWSFRRIEEFGRKYKDVTTIFGPGITENMIARRFSSGATSVRAELRDQRIIMTGKVELDYQVPGSKKPKTGTFDVEIWVCRTNCEPGSVGDVITMFPKKGPEDGIFKIRRSAEGGSGK